MQKKIGKAVLILVAMLLAAAAGITLGNLALTGKKGLDFVIELTDEHKNEIPFVEVDQEQAEALAGYYYHHQLTEEEQKVYLEIQQGIAEEQEQIYIHCNDEEEIKRIYAFVLDDHPEYFWCTGALHMTTYTNKDQSEEEYGVITPMASVSGEDRVKTRAEIDRVVQEFLAQVDTEASDYDKIKNVYEYIINTTDYDLASEDNQAIGSVLLNHRSVCAGYSRTTQYLLNQLGIECTYVTGYVREDQDDVTTAITPETGTAHAWNLVACDGRYYYVDTTWGDPIFLQEEGELPAGVSNISYDYLCCSDGELFKTHLLEEGLNMPPCNSLDKNYYLLNGMYYETYDASIILQAFYDDIDQKSPETIVKFANDELYQQARDEIIESLIELGVQRIAGMYGLNEVEYYYQESPETDKITVFWQYQ